MRLFLPSVVFPPVAARIRAAVGEGTGVFGRGQGGGGRAPGRRHSVTGGRQTCYPAGATCGARSIAGSVKTSSSSRLVEENSETTAPSTPARNQWRVSGGIVVWSPGRSVIVFPATFSSTVP